MSQAGQPVESLRERVGRRWGLLVLTGLGALLAGVAPFQNWYTNLLIVFSPGAAEEDAKGITLFGVWGIALGIGDLLLAIVVLVAVLTPQRLATPLAFAALGLVAILVADLVVIATALDKATLAAAEGAAALAAAADSKVLFHIFSAGTELSLGAILLLGLVAAQLPRRDLAPRVVAGIAGALGVLSLALPWVTAYVEVGGRLRVDRFWVFTAPPDVAVLGVGMVLVVGLAGGLALLSRTPPPMLVAAIAAGPVAIVLSVVYPPRDQVEQHLAHHHVLNAPHGFAVPFALYASVLLMVAGIRLAWRRSRGAGVTPQAGPSGGPVGHPAPPIGTGAPWVYPGSPGGQPAGGRVAPPGERPVPPEANGVAGSPPWTTAR